MLCSVGNQPVESMESVVKKKKKAAAGRICRKGFKPKQVGRQEGHPACKKQSGGCWHGYLSGARCRLAYGPADATDIHCLLLQ